MTDKIFTGDTIRDILGKGGGVNIKHGGGDKRADWEDRLDARLEKQKKKAGLLAGKFIPRSVVMSGDGGKIYTVNGVVVTKGEYDKAGVRSDDA